MKLSSSRLKPSVLVAVIISSCGNEFHQLTLHWLKYHLLWSVLDLWLSNFIVCSIALELWDREKKLPLSIFTMPRITSYQSIIFHPVVFISKQKWSKMPQSYLTGVPALWSFCLPFSVPFPALLYLIWNGTSRTYTGFQTSSVFSGNDTAKCLKNSCGLHLLFAFGFVSSS